MVTKEKIEKLSAMKNFTIANATPDIWSKITDNKINYMIQTNQHIVGNLFDAYYTREIDAYGTREQVENSNCFPKTLSSVKNKNICMFFFTEEQDYKEALHKLWKRGFAINGSYVPWFIK